MKNVIYMCVCLMLIICNNCCNNDNDIILEYKDVELKIIKTDEENFSWIEISGVNRIYVNISGMTTHKKHDTLEVIVYAIYKSKHSNPFFLNRLGFVKGVNIITFGKEKTVVWKSK